MTGVYASRFQIVSFQLTPIMSEQISKRLGKFPLSLETPEQFYRHTQIHRAESGIVFVNAESESARDGFKDVFPIQWALIGCHMMQNKLRFVALRESDTPLTALLNSDFSLPAERLGRINTGTIHQLALVNEVAREISTLHDVRAILTSINDQLIDRFGYYHATVGVIEGNEIVMYEATPRSRAISQDKPFRLKLDSPGTLPWVARHGRARIVEDTLEDEIWVPGAGLEATRSELTIPMVLHGVTLGIIDIQSEYPNAFNETDLWLLEALASQIAIALAHARLVRELSERAEEVTVLLETSQAIAVALSLDSRLNVIVQRARDLFNADNVILFTLNDNKTLKPLIAIHSHLDELMVSSLQVGEGLTGRVVQEGKGIILNYDEPSWRSRSQLIPDTPDIPECLMSTPLRLEDDVIGAITVTRESKVGFTPSDLHLLEGFASLVTVALVNVRLVELNMRQRERAEALNVVARLTSGTLNLDEVLRNALELLPTFVQFNYVLLGLIEDQHLHIVHQSGYAGLENGQLIALDSLPLIQTVLQTHQLKVVVDTAHHHGWSNDLQSTAQSWIGVPLISHGITIGILTVASDTAGLYSPDDSDQLLAFAGQIALAIDNARLYQELKIRAYHLQRAYDDLAEADRLKDELIQNVSHELRTPLTFIKSYVELLLDEALGDLEPSQRQSLDIVARKTNTLIQLVSDIVSAQKFDRSTLHLKSVRMNQLLEHHIEGILPTLKREERPLHVEIEPELPVTLADPNRIQQILNNFTANALKFSPRATALTIRAYKKNRMIHVEVEDQGIGIEKDQQERIFDRFFQADGTTTRRYGGIGLGLAISKQIIDAHDGIIGVISTPGVGSRFYFELPIVTPIEDTDALRA